MTITLPVSLIVAALTAVIFTFILWKDYRGSRDSLGIEALFRSFLTVISYLFILLCLTAGAYLKWWNL